MFGLQPEQLKEKHKSNWEMLLMLVGADLLVAGLVNEVGKPQWTHAGARMTGLSLGKGMPSPLQVAGPDVSC